MRLINFTISLICLTCFTGCLNNVEDISESTDYDPNDVSYADQIQPILTQSCGGSGCHVNSSTSGVNVSSYDALMNSSGIVYGEPVINPGNPDESPLVDKIEPNPQFGSRMPQGGPFLTNDEIAQIRAWIEGGAEDN